MDRVRVLSIAAASFVAFVGLSDSAHAKLGSAAEPEVHFTAVGPAGMHIDGVGSELSVAEDGGAVRVVVPLANLKTGIELRDKHMRENYLETAAFPNAELVVPRAALKLPAGNDAVSAEAQGTMKIHGTARPAVFRYTVRRSGDAFGVAGSVSVNMNEFGIKVPSYLGVTVKPDVQITVRFTARDA